MSWSKALESVTNLASEWIEDPDKAKEVALELERLRNEMDLALLGTTTTPRTDAFIKILFAFKNVVIPMFRPVGSALMAGFAAYCIVHKIMLPEYIEAMLVGSPLLWGYSRHKGKAKGKHHTNEADQDDFFD